MALDFLESLTEPQRRAVTFGEGPLLVLAGPGSGKTRVITFRIAFLLNQGVAPGQILALTFTNKAAREISERVDALVGWTGVWVGTFHGLCAKLLRRYARLVGLEPNFTIYDEDQSDRLLREVVARRLGGKQSLSVSAIAQSIHWAKSHLVLPEGFLPTDRGVPPDVLRDIYVEYQRELLRNNAVDFDDLLLHIARILGEHPGLKAELDEQFRFVLVDEYQDTNLAQYAIIRSICVDYPNLTVTGDPDQSIYRWRGATLRNILEFERDYPYVEVIRLEESYRSTQRILRAAESLIVHNSRRKAKRLFTRNPEGPPVRLVVFRSDQEEAAGIAQEITGAVKSGKRRFRDFAILCRVNTMTRLFELALRQSGIPYQVVNGVEFFRRREVQDLLAYLRLLVNPKDHEAFLRLSQRPPRGIGLRTLGHLGELAGRLRMSLFELLQSGLWRPEFSGKTRKALDGLAELLTALSSTQHSSVEGLLYDVIERSGYRAWLAQESRSEREDRLRNVDELLAAARDFDQLQPGGDVGLFLQQVALVAETDRWEDRADCVAVMTLHAAKGLEFPVVYIVGLEQGVLPYEDSWQDVEELEEERRLLFVGMTRAREELILTRAVYRQHRGYMRLTIPSHFLLEIWREDLQIDDRSEEHTGIVLARSNDGGCFAGKGDSLPATKHGSLQTPNLPSGQLRVALDLFGAQGEVASAEDFEIGCLVVHPQYGLGRIVAVSSGAETHKVAVEFPGPVGIVQIARPELQLRLIRHKTGAQTDRQEK